MNKIIIFLVFIALAGCMTTYHENGEIKREPASNAARKNLQASAEKCLEKIDPDARQEQLDISKMSEHAQIAYAAGMAVAEAVRAMTPQSSHPCTQATVAYERTRQVQSTNRTSLGKSAIIGVGVIAGVRAVESMMAAAVGAAGNRVYMGSAHAGGGGKGGNSILGSGSDAPSSSSSASSSGSIDNTVINMGHQNHIPTDFNEAGGIPVNPIDINDTAFTTPVVTEAETVSPPSSTISSPATTLVTPEIE